MVIPEQRLSLQATPKLNLPRLQTITLLMENKAHSLEFFVRDIVQRTGADRFLYLLFLQEVVELAATKEGFCMAGLEYAPYLT